MNEPDPQHCGAKPPLVRLKFSDENQPDWPAFVLLEMAPRAVILVRNGAASPLGCCPPA
jgi:hypothetical protein